MSGEETRETTHTTTPAATGRRLAISLALVVVGLILIAIGALSGAAALIVIGGALTLVFGLVASGARQVGYRTEEGTSVGAELPPSKETVETTVRTRGFPLHGPSPAEPRQRPPTSEETSPGRQNSEEL